MSVHQPLDIKAILKVTKRHSAFKGLSMLQLDGVAQPYRRAKVLAVRMATVEGGLKSLCPILVVLQLTVVGSKRT